MTKNGGGGMTAFRIGAVALILAGVLGLAYGKFSYTEDRDTLRVGDLALTVEDRRSVNVPMWLGVGAIVAGALALVATARGARA